MQCDVHPRNFGSLVALRSCYTSTWVIYTVVAKFVHRYISPNRDMCTYRLLVSECVNHIPNIRHQPVSPQRQHRLNNQDIFTTRQRLPYTCQAQTTYHSLSIRVCWNLTQQKDRLLESQHDNIWTLYVYGYYLSMLCPEVCRSKHNPTILYIYIYIYYITSPCIYIYIYHTT
jgi:hypothetical protein